MSTQEPDLDLVALSAWAAGRLPGFDATLRARKFPMGQSNPTYLLIAGQHRYVLRRKPLGKLLKSAHAVEREFRVQQALRATDVPVPEMFLLCEDPEVIGAAFYIMAYVQGQSFDDPRLPQLPRDSRAPVMQEMCRVLSALHNVDLAATDLLDYGPPGDYFARQLGRWTAQYRLSATQSLPEMERLIAQLERALPEEDGQRTLVHGDYRIDNMIFAPDGSQCRAVLDWELSTLGHPYADLAGVIMQWQMPPGPEGRGLLGVDRRAEGLLTDQEFIARYCLMRGIKGIENFGFYLGFSFFRMAAILQGVLKRAEEGTASNQEKGRRLGRLVPEFTRAGIVALENGLR